MNGGGKQLLKLIDEAKADRDVLAVIIFGSHARGEGGPSADLDVCLVLEPGKYSDLDLSHKYSDLDLSHKKLEYLKLFDLDVSVFQQLPLYIRSRVLKEGKVLFCRDEDALYQLAFRTAQQFEDFRHMYHEYLEEVARG